ncbi:hypothetical protein [Pedobacter africanus]|nr:hypothetical protein [Pedobacter africanus]
MKDTVPDNNIFPTSLICFSLLPLAHLDEVDEILQLTASFLQYQSMRAGVWNNFTKAHKYFKICPADVDNTACASIVLKRLQREFTNNEQILLLNRNNKGLFYTWFTFRPNKVWNRDYWMLILRELRFPLSSWIFWTKNEAGKYDIDGAVNANVLFYLGLKDSTRPIIKFIKDIILTNKENDCDKWYRNPFTIYYFFSRNYAAGLTELEAIKLPVTERILAKVQENGAVGNGVLDTALAVISLINLGYENNLVLRAAVNFIISKQEKNGEWPRWALYYGGPKKLQCYGSEEATTGFCLEALALYQKSLKI